MAGFLYQYLTANMTGTNTEIYRWVQFACATGALCTAVPGAISARTTVEMAEKFLSLHSQILKIVNNEKSRHPLIKQ